MMKRWLMVLFSSIVISGCASTTTDTVKVTTIDEEKFSEIVKRCTNICFSESVAESYKKNRVIDEAIKKPCEIGCKQGLMEYYERVKNPRERMAQPAYQQPSYDQNLEIRRLRDDLTVQSIIQRGEAEKREQEMMRRLETERSNRESMERVKEQQRQIEQSIQEDNRRREMHKLRQDLLYRGIY